jgi:hypothetical protein
MKLIVPTKLEEITVEQFIKYNRMINIEGLEQDALNLGIVSCFCNITLEEALKISVTDISETVDLINEVLQHKVNFNPIYKNFGFIPNFDKCTTAEYTDLERYISDYENYHRAMAVMYRPIAKKLLGQYTIEPYNGTDKYCDEMLNVPATYLLGAMVFFWNLNSDLLAATNVYLQQANLTSEVSGKVSGLSGVGIQALIQLLKDAELQSKTLVN